jgi:hypothetical protein
MGYYTEYKLQIIPHSEEIYNLFLEDTGYIEDDSTKWYSWKEDCQGLSKQNLGYLIILSGEGESIRDIWKTAFLNGELVWEWYLDYTIPEVPQTIIEQGEIEFALHQSSSIKEKITQLQHQIIELRKYLGEPES